MAFLSDKLKKEREKRLLKIKTKFKAKTKNIMEHKGPLSPDNPKNQAKVKKKKNVITVKAPTIKVTPKKTTAVKGTMKGQQVDTTRGMFKESGSKVSPKKTTTTSTNKATNQSVKTTNNTKTTANKKKEDDRRAWGRNQQRNAQRSMGFK